MAERHESESMVPSRRGGRWKVVVLGAAILVCGMVIGAGLTLHLLRTNLQYLAQEPERLPGIVAHRMENALDLTPEQREAVEAILNERLRALDEIRRENRPRVEAEVNAIRDEVAAVLRPEQAEAWTARFDTLRERWSPEFFPAE